MGRFSAIAVTLLAAAAMCGGCIYDGLVIDDGTGFSRGPSRAGMLYEGTKLPTRGLGYWVPPTWAERGLNYGVDELVSTVVYVGRTLHQIDPRLELAVGDLSRSYGGRSPWHRSHQTGRDIDLLFLVKDKAGKPIRSDRMRKHDPSGAERVVKGARPEVFFDERGNWLVVAALLENPISEVQYIFVQADLRQRMLNYARRAGASKALLARAAETLKQPSDSAPHDDHLHVRIYCPDDDLAMGCEDFGQMRWTKKDRKYGGRLARLRRYEEVASDIELGPISALVR